MLAIGAFLTGLGFSLLPLGSGYGLALLSVAVWTVGEMLIAPTSEGFVAARAAPEARGRFMGVSVLAWSLAFVVAPLSGTFVYDRFGPTALWFGCGALGVFLLAAFLTLAEVSRRGAASPSDRQAR